MPATRRRFAMKRPDVVVKAVNPVADKPQAKVRFPVKLINFTLNRHPVQTMFQQRTDSHLAAAAEFIVLFRIKRMVLIPVASAGDLKPALTHFRKRKGFGAGQSPV